VPDDRASRRHSVEHVDDRYDLRQQRQGGATQSKNACVIVESMLASASGLPVQYACERRDLPRCRFMIGSDANAE